MATTVAEAKIFDALKQKAPIEEIKLLIDAPGVKIDFNDENFMTPLMYACYQGNVELIKLLISYGSNINNNCHKDGYTPLMFAAISGKEEAVKLLLENNVNVFNKNKLGRTASQMASFVGYRNIAKLIANFIPLSNINLILHDLRIKQNNCSKLSTKFSHNIQTYLNSTNSSLIYLVKFLTHHPTLLEHEALVKDILEELGGLGQNSLREDEILSLRCHYVSHLLSYLTTKSTNKAHDDKLLKAQAANKFLKMLIKDKWQSKKLIRTSLVEKYLCQMIKDYPHKGDSVFKNVMLQLNSSHLGNSLSASEVLSNILSGGTPSFATAEENSKVRACNVCGEKENVKVCLKCQKVYYCDAECQKLEWPYHKGSCRSPQ